MNTRDSRYCIIYVRLTKAELDALRAAAKADMRTVSSMARFLIAESLSPQPITPNQPRRKYGMSADTLIKGMRK